MEKITVSAIINAEKSKVWEYYTHPDHIVHWNFADSSWHCPRASNDMWVGGYTKQEWKQKTGAPVLILRLRTLTSVSWKVFRMSLVGGLLQLFLRMLTVKQK